MIEFPLAALSWFAPPSAQLFAAHFEVWRSNFRTIGAVLPGTFFPRVQIAVALVRP